MAATNKTDAAVAHHVTAPFRKTSNFLALAVAAYRDGDPETAFDLFLTGMESHLKDGETAEIDTAFSSLIEQALTEARNMSLTVLMDGVDEDDNNQLELDTASGFGLGSLDESDLAFAELPENSVEVEARRASSNESAWYERCGELLARIGDGTYAIAGKSSDELELLGGLLGLDLVEATDADETTYRLTAAGLKMITEAASGDSLVAAFKAVEKAQETARLAEVSNNLADLDEAA